MGLLPGLTGESSERLVTDCFTGYDHNLKIADGAFYHTQNLTSACAPLLANRKKRGRVARLTAPGGLIAKEKLAWVDGTRLYYDGAATPLQLSAGEKRLVSMGAYLCVFPDKLYYNTADPTDYGSMEAVYRSTGAVRYSLCRSDGTDYDSPTVSASQPEEREDGALWIDTGQDAPTLRQWSEAESGWLSIPTVYTKLSFISQGELPALFRPLDGVTVSGAAAESVNGEKIIHALGGDAQSMDYLVVTGLLEEALTQSEGSVTISRRVPELDYVVECRNRLWGCRYGHSGDGELNELYCCALGDFRNWRQFMGASTDSWTASVGSDGPWTGAVNYLGCPMFFKENRIHRVTVSPTGAHQVTETVCRGVQAGSAGSLQVVNETLFYKSRGDVCAYQGGFPQSISQALGEELYRDAAAGAVGDRYYIAMTDSRGERSLFVYDIRRGLWMREDALPVTAFARLGDELYALAEGQLYALLGSAGEPEPYVTWEAETGLLGYQYPEQKYLSRFSLRLWMEEGAQLDVYVQYDSSGVWQHQGHIAMRGTRTVTLPIRPRRCDHLRVRLKGRGEMRLYSIAKILSIGSDVE